MKKMRILLANRPRLMREVIREMIERQPDMEIVGEVLDSVGLLIAVRETGADAVILGLSESASPGVSSQLFGEYPDLTILGLAAHGEQAFIEQLCPRRSEIRDPSEATVLRALRQAIHAPCSEGPVS